MWVFGHHVRVTQDPVRGGCPTASVPSGHPEPMLGSGQGWASVLGEPQAADMLCFGSIREWPLTHVLSLKPGSGLQLKCRPPHAAAGSASLCPRAVQAAAGLGRSAHGGRPGLGRTVLWAPEAEGQGAWSGAHSDHTGDRTGRGHGEAAPRPLGRGPLGQPGLLLPRS